MSSTNSQVTLYDTTLRDGAQGEGINFSLADKLRIAQRLDAFGMHYIEGGWPGSNGKDIEFFREVKKLKLKHAKIAAFGSTRRASPPPGSTSQPQLRGTELAASDPQVKTLLEAETPVVTLVCKTSMLHVREILQKPFGIEQLLASVDNILRPLPEMSADPVQHGLAHDPRDGASLEPRKSRF